MNYFIPKYITNNAIVLYFLILATVSLLFMNYALRWMWIAFGVVEVFSFFYFSNLLTKSWGRYSNHLFARSLFGWALAIRVLYVIFSYFFYLEQTGAPFEFDAADVGFYHEMGKYGASLLENGEFDLIPKFNKYSGGMAFSDTGYPIYLSVVYYLTGNSIFITRVLKAVWSAWTVLLIYKLARRNFSEPTARMAGILCMLMPNLIYYCGLHLKETEMVFLMTLFIERADYVMRQGRFVLAPTLTVVLTGLYLFMFRTVLGAVLFIAFFMALTLSSTRLVSWGRRTILVVLSLAMLGLMFSNRIGEEILSISETNVQQQQQGNYEWRANRENGNAFAKYGSMVVFAPMIFTIPFPTMVETSGQENQKMIHGGNFCKNITSFFTIIGLVMLIWPYNWRKRLLDGEWRKHLLPIAVLGGYLIVLVFSNFAHSERFHLPTLPLAMMFAAYGISNFQPKWKRWYWVWLAIIFVANIGWAYIKLAGRGML